MTKPALPVSKDLARRLSGAPALLLLDIDGTLAPIAPTPQEAVVPDETKRVVAALARRRRTHVAIVSGRAAADARRLVGVGHVWVIGNHGMEILTPEGDSTVIAGVEPYLSSVAAAASKLGALVASVPGVVLEDKRLTLSLHYRLANPAIVPRLSQVVAEVAHEQALRVTTGKQVLELRPPVEVHKGTAVLELAESLGALADGATTLFAGDDRTDEDAFALLRTRHAEAVTVRVGPEPFAIESPTDAEFFVPDPSALVELLKWILARD